MWRKALAAAAACAALAVAAQAGPASGPPPVSAAAPAPAGLAMPGRLYRFDGALVSRPWLWLLSQARASGWPGHVKGPASGLRTYAQQDALFHLYLAGKGAPAFDPDGPSRHMITNLGPGRWWMQAADITAPERFIAAAARLHVAIVRPYLPREPWHVEAARAFGPPVTFLAPGQPVLARP